MNTRRSLDKGRQNCVGNWEGLGKGREGEGEGANKLNVSMDESNPSASFTQAGVSQLLEDDEEPLFSWSETYTARNTMSPITVKQRNMIIQVFHFPLSSGDPPN